MDILNEFRLQGGKLYLGNLSAAQLAVLQLRLDHLAWPLVTPAIDLILSSRYIPERFNQFDDIGTFYVGLASFRFNMHNVQYRFGTETCYTYLEFLLADVSTLIDAIDRDRAGEEFSLKIKHLYPDPPIVDWSPKSLPILELDAS